MNFSTYNMSFEYRKAHIEFVSKEIVIATTNFKQKKFYLDEDCVIDLIKLEKMNNAVITADFHLSFFVNFMYEEEEQSFIGEVVAKLGKDSLDIIGLSDWKRYNKRNFRISVWVND